MSNIIQLEGLGVDWLIEIEDNLDSTEIKTFVEHEVREFGANFSRFNTTSELAKLNTARKLENPTAEMQYLLQLCLEFNYLTEGYFNPAIGSILENRGYDKDYSFTLKSTAEHVSDFRNLLVISNDTILLQGNGDIDLGGIGKGYLIDRFVTIFVEKFGLKEFSIHGGGDLYIHQSQEIYLENPYRDEQNLGKIYLKNQALGSASNVKRRWQDPKTRKVFGHIVNPKSLNKVLDKTSYVIAKNAVTADVIATVVCILADHEDILQRIKGHLEFEYLILSPNGTYVKSSGFPELTV